ncbi:pyrroline-5-carboxylate reductase [Candidatus Marinamargulisbacteria bacterium SCGC AG-439-L15]|nr:pyrroline-5-carboxylate reductase [Candidatus Marinamargulisbacteria bacterium SCGC AG-439-L15]
MGSTRYKLGFIGFGKMAEAIYQGISQRSLVSDERICFSEHNESRTSQVASSLGIKSLSIEELVQSSDIVLLCVKPQQVQEVLSQFPKQLYATTCVVSILAGTPVRTLSDILGADAQVCRAMPNTPLLLGEGMTALYRGHTVSDDNWTAVCDVFSTAGQVVDVDDESLLDVVTGVSGSGPAFLYRLASDIAELGTKEGLSNELSLQLIAQTMVGAGKMLLGSGKSPETLIQDVSSPNGTTVAGLDQFDKTQLSLDMQSVVQASIDRARELGGQS